MAHPIEEAAAKAVKEQRELNLKLANLEQELRASVDRENVLQGQVLSLEKQLAESRERRDHMAMAIGEVSKQLNNVGMIVHDAMVVARTEIQKVKGNGPDVAPLALEAVDKALEEVKDDLRPPFPPIPGPRK